jgi:hypothetical protein
VVCKRIGSSKLRFPILIRRWALVVGVGVAKESVAVDVRENRIRQRRS